MQGDLAGQSAGERVLDTDIIATYYQKWLKSEPFNIDSSVYKSVNMLGDIPKAKVARFIAEKENQNSMTSRSLSRIAPLAIWASSLNHEDTTKAIQAESSLSHPNSLVQEAS